MTQKRNRRAGVEDRWKRADGRPSARAGSGKRWMARFVDEQGRENTKSFDRQKAAQAWLDEITAQGHLKETTVATRAYTWTSHVEPRWADVAVADVQTSAVQRGCALGTNVALLMPTSHAPAARC
jgi:hypothetical protein